MVGDKWYERIARIIVRTFFSIKETSPDRDESGSTFIRIILYPLAQV